MSSSPFAELDASLRRTLRPVAPPVAIRFLAEDAPGADTTLEDAMPPPTASGRTGRAPAGCVFWMRGAEATFTTRAEDHANCSVGSFTHGFLTLEEAVERDDVEAVLEAGWVDAAAMRALPRLPAAPHRVAYGPLAVAAAAPDVVLLRILGQGLMTLRDTFPDLPIEGKPQCHIVAMAAQGRPAASVGCALSRARTGMKPEEMTVALPGDRLEPMAADLEATAELNGGMARYAAMDAKRF